MKKSFILMTFFIVLNQQGVAKENPTVKLEETVVTAESFGNSVLKSPKNITVVTAKDIKERGAQSIEDALKTVPGLMAYNNMGGSDAKISFRGMIPGKEEQNILFLMDGLPYNSVVDTGGVNLNLIPIDNVERIEVLPNSGNILYGEGAVAGVINIITKKPRKDKYYGSFSYEIGSYDLKNYKLNLGTNITKNLSFDIKYNDKRQNNYRDHHTRDVEHFDINMKYNMTGHSLNLNFQHSDTEYRFPGYLSKKDIENKKIKESTSKIKGKENLKIYKVKYEGKWAENLDFIIAGDFKDKLYKSIDEKNGEVSTIRDTETFYISPQIKYTYMPKSYFILGGDYLEGRSKYTYKKETKTDTSKKSLGLFISNTFQWNDFIFTQAYRHQKIKYDVKDLLNPNPKSAKSKTLNKAFNEDAYELSANYLFNDTSSIYLTYSKAFRAPTAGEAGRWRSKYEVKTQNSDTFELGLKTAGNWFFLSGSIFQTNTANEIFYVAYENGKLGNNYNLPGKNQRRGIELSMEQYLGNITFRESFSYLSHKIKSGVFAGSKIPGVPEYIYSLGMDYKLTDNLTWSTSYNHYGGTYIVYDFHNKHPKQKGHGELDTSLNYEMENGLSIYGGIKNLLDKEYFNPKLDSKGTKVNYYYGTRRNYYVGIRYTF